MKSRGAVFLWSQSFAATAHKEMRGGTIATSFFFWDSGAACASLAFLELRESSDLRFGKRIVS